MRKNPRYYVKHEMLTRKEAYKTFRSQKRRSALEKQRETDRNAVTTERRRRDSALSSPKSLLVRDSNSEMIHFVLCKRVKYIPDNEFSIYEGTITTESTLCSNCKRMIWISKGMANQRNSVSICNAFLNYIRVNNQLVEELFVTHKAQARLIDSYNLQIEVYGEKWILTRTDSNHMVRILHNNYGMADNGTRVSMIGFHDQYRGKELLGARAVKCILNYRNHQAVYKTKGEKHE